MYNIVILWPKSKSIDSQRQEHKQAILQYLFLVIIVCIRHVLQQRKTLAYLKP